MSSVKWYPSSAVADCSIGVVPLYKAGAYWLVSPPRKPKKCSNPPPPVGHASKGPTGLVCHTGTSWHLPNCAVAYPLSRSTSASGAVDCGRTDVYPGAAVAISVMAPIPTAWWLRPVNSACRVGAHRAVVWNREKDRPLSANRSAEGVRHGPPKTLAAPKPTSSSRITSTLGAASGGRTGTIGSNTARGSLASSKTGPAYSLSGIGRIERSTTHSLVANDNRATLPGRCTRGQATGGRRSSGGDRPVPHTQCRMRACSTPRRPDLRLSVDPQATHRTRGNREATPPESAWHCGPAKDLDHRRPPDDTTGHSLGGQLSGDRREGDRRHPRGLWPIRLHAVPPHSTERQTCTDRAPRGLPDVEHPRVCDHCSPSIRFSRRRRGLPT